MADVSFELKLKTLNKSRVWQNSLCPCWLNIGSQVHKYIVFWGFFLHHHYRVDFKSNHQTNQIIASTVKDFYFINSLHSYRLKSN